MHGNENASFKIEKKKTDVVHTGIDIKNTNKYEICKVHAKLFKNLIVIVVSTSKNAKNKTLA